MSFSVRYTPAVLFTLFSLAVTLSAQSPNTQPGKAPRGSVSGRVTIKDKGAAGVAVGLRKSEINPFEQHLRATTDQDGFYRIANVPAGSYEVGPSVPAFILANDNNNQRGKTVVVGEEEHVEGINFSLIRGGVITGKVTDADGRPVIQQQVSLFMAETFNQPQREPGRMIFATQQVPTDDRGIYRMYGLRAGKYKVGTGRGEDSYMAGYNENRTSYKQVFHPDVSDQAKATIIEVSEGSEATNVDIKLGPALQTFSVSGRVIEAERGLPVANIHFTLQRFSGQRPAEFINSSLTSNVQGEFYTEGLIPGRYQIYLFQEMNADLRADTVSFEITDQDVSDVTVRLTKGASLSGVIVFESEDKAAHQKLLQMRLRAQVAPKPGGPQYFGQSTMAPISPDGSFRLGGLPSGTANVVLTSAMGVFFTKGFTISRIERDGVIMRGVEVKDGEQVSGLRVFVAYGNGSIRGVVKLENGTLPEGAQMFVRLTKPGEPPPALRPSAVDARGHFLMEGIPPGNYEVVVQVFSGSRTPLRTAKREVTVQDGIVTDVMLTVDLTPPPTPTPKP